MSNEGKDCSIIIAGTTKYTFIGKNIVKSVFPISACTSQALCDISKKQTFYDLNTPLHPIPKFKIQ